MKQTINESFMSLSVCQFSRDKQSTQKKYSGNSDFEQGESLIFRDVVHKFDLLFQRPIIRSCEIILVALRKMFPELHHILDNTSGMPDQGISALFAGRIQRVDDIGLNIGDRVGEQEVLREVTKVPARRMRSVGI